MNDKKCEDKKYKRMEELINIHDIDALLYQDLVYTLVVRTRYNNYYMYKPFMIPDVIYMGNLAEEYTSWCTQQVFYIKEQIYNGFNIYCVELALVDTNKNVKIFSSIYNLNDNEKFNQFKAKCSKFYHNKIQPYYKNMGNVDKNEDGNILKKQRKLKAKKQSKSEVKEPPKDSVSNNKYFIDHQGNL